MVGSGAGAGLLKRKGDWQFSYLVVSRFIVFTFRNYFTKPSSNAGRSRH